MLDFLGSVKIVFVLFRVGLDTKVRKIAQNLQVRASCDWRQDCSERGPHSVLGDRASSGRRPPVAPNPSTAALISTRTVASHRQNIMRKLDVYSVSGLIKYAIREALTTVKD